MDPWQTATGVGMISAGAPTHSPKAADFILEIRGSTDTVEV
ncbi:MAG: hypothetical protein R6X27_07230 [Candidatus Desulfacyla sp.]